MRWIFGAAASLAMAVTAAQAGVITNIDIFSSDTGSNYYFGHWSGAINGAAIQAVVESGTGNTGTGLTFADASGQYLEVDNGGSVTIGSLSIALTSNSVVNTLFNNFYGDAIGSDEGQVTFFNSSGDSLAVSLVAGQSIRDYNNSGYANTLSGASPGVTAMNWWNTGDAGSTVNGEPRQRLDAQTFVLPASWAGTSLTKVEVSDPAGNRGLDILSAMQANVMPGTVTSTVAEPASVWFIIAGFGLLGGMAWRGRAAV